MANYGEVEFDAIIDLCDSLAPTEENKNMLLCAIDTFDIDELYDTLTPLLGEFPIGEARRNFYGFMKSVPPRCRPTHYTHSVCTVGRTLCCQPPLRGP